RPARGHALFRHDQLDTHLDGPGGSRQAGAHRRARRQRLSRRIHRNRVSTLRGETVKSMLALCALAALLAAPAVAAPVVTRDHDHSALSEKGDRIADVEADDPGNLPDEPHGRVIVHAADGKVLGSYDPCGTCKYSDTAFSRKGDSLAFIATDRK